MKGDKLKFTQDCMRKVKRFTVPILYEHLKSQEISKNNIQVVVDKLLKEDFIMRLGNVGGFCQYEVVETSPVNIGFKKFCY